ARINLADAKNSTHPSVCHLDVVHRILLGLCGSEVDVEDQLRVTLAHEEEIPHRVTADLVHQVANGDITARTLGDLYLFSVLHHRDHLMQHVLRVLLRYAQLEGLQSGAYARHGAVVIRPLNVDGAAKAALPFCNVIGDVGEKIGVRSVALPHHSILVVAEFGGAKPERSLVLVGLSRGDQQPHRVLDHSLGVERGLEEIVVETNSKGLQVEILFLPQLPHRELTN